MSLKELRDELTKAKQLAADGFADNYLLMTNAGISGVAHQQIVRAFLALPGIRECRVFGKDRLCQFIRESPRLRMLVPRVYGLGDLSQILDQRAYDQAQEILSSLGDDLAKFVITEAHRKSAHAILDHGFVLLLGEPAAGKSTIAAALAIGALDLWNCWPIKVNGAQEFKDRWNPHERQFFWIDDVFGATQYDRHRVAEWNHVLGHLNAAVKKHTRVLFTSRDYIYQWAVSDLKLEAFPPLRESQVVIEVSKLTKPEREQILYNHLKLGNQPRDFKKRIKPYLELVAAHPDFKPEIARRLGDPLFTRSLAITEEDVLRFVGQPLEFLLDIIRTLDVASKAALALIFMRAGQTPSPLELTSEETKAMHLLGADFADVRQALRALDPSLVLRVREHGRLWWKFKHPTVRDAISIQVADDPELMSIYLAGAPLEKMTGEITCGDSEAKNAKIVVPSQHYMLVIQRLKELNDEAYSDHWEQRQRLPRFLAYRCDNEFLRRYVRSDPKVFERLQHFGAYLGAFTEPRLLARFHSMGLLPEGQRKLFARNVQEILGHTLDDGFLEIDGLRAMFTKGELRECLQRVRKRILDGLDADIMEEETDFDPDEDSPDSHFDSLKDRLRTFQREFEGDDDVYAAIESGLEEIRDAKRRLRRKVEEKEAEEENETEENPFEREPAAARQEAQRLIFDDIDE